MSILKNKNILQILILAVFFCFGIGLFNLTGYIFIGLTGLLLLFWFRYIEFTYSELLLMLFSAFYFCFYLFHYEFSLDIVVQYLIGPWSAYLIGKIFVKRFDDRFGMLKLIITLSIGMCLHGILNLLAYLRSNYVNTYSYYRIAVDFWRNDIVSVTVTGMFFTFATGISIGVLFSDKNKVHKLIAAIFLLSCVFATVIFANRTLLLIILLIVVWRIFLVFSSNKVSLSHKVVVLISLVLILLCSFLVIKTNLFGIGDNFYSLKIVERIIGDSNSSSRTAGFAVFLDNGAWLKYPFGGRKITVGFHSSFLHNLWLDIYNTAGVLPFIIFVIFTITQFKRFFRFRQCMLFDNRDKFNSTTYVIIQCLMLSLLLNCMVEPIIEANPYYFLIIMIFCGAIDGHVEILSETKKLEPHK